MANFLVVDGYNIIHAWDELKKLTEKDLDHARSRLIDLLAEYGAAKDLDVIVVFDAHMVKGGTGSRDHVNSVQIVYTTEGETADMFIERFTASLENGDTVAVATSDWDQQRVVFGKGAYRISARELQKEIQLCKNELRENYINNHGFEGTIRNYVNNNIREMLEKIRRQK